jgi:hypothetical protein
LQIQSIASTNHYLFHSTLGNKYAGYSQKYPYFSPYFPTNCISNSLIRFFNARSSANFTDSLRITATMAETAPSELFSRFTAVHHRRFVQLRQINQAVVEFARNR